MKTAIVLGGTVPHIDLVCQLKKRGYKTILVDYTKSPPAKEYADEHIRESTLDRDIILKIAKDYNADLVISSSVDQANVVCCYVAEKLGLPHPYSYETALNVTDKVRMKSIMHEHGIETSKHISIQRFDEVRKASLRFPIMIKPADSNSAKGVKKAETMEKAEEAFNIAKEYSRNGMVIAEEFVEGVEISAYGYISNHTPIIIMIQERISTYDGDDKVLKCYASWAPARISEKAREKAQDVLGQIAEVFGLDNTPLFFQGIVREDDISVIEFAPRTGGGISTQTIKKAVGFDFISATIDSYFGVEPDFSSYHPMQKIFAVNQVYADSGEIASITGYEKLKESGLVDIISFYRRQHANTNALTASSSRVFVMVVSGENQLEIKNKIQASFDQIDIIDIEGKSIIRRDLSLNNIELNEMFERT